MGRMTRRAPDGTACYKPMDPDCGSCSSCSRVHEHMMLLTERLAAYEDTGLEPEEINALKKAKHWREVEPITDIEGCSIELVREFVRAYKAGRLCVIPAYQWIPVEGGLHKCGKCHTVRKADPARDHYCPNCGFKMHGADDKAMEEAEEALKEETER